MAPPYHVLLVTFPAQGHINPTLQLAKRLISLGVRVTYLTTDTAINLMNKESLLDEGLSFASFSEGDLTQEDMDGFVFGLEHCGSPALRELISSNTKQGLEMPRKQLEILDGETKPRILVNTFDALEPTALQAIQNYKMVGVGPLLPSAFLDGKNPSDTSFGGDLFKGTKDKYIQWLDSMPEASVVYVSFGSMSVLEKTQKEETARGLLATGFRFLWVMRDSGHGEREYDELSYKEELEKQGMIVSWCSQVEVLSHPSIGCFLTHCGWNSTLESLASGVPVVAFPQWSDQGTNSKLVQDVWKTGMRVTKNEKGIVESPELKRCLELVMGNEKMRYNAKKWKDLAREAVMEGGSSDNNLKAFVDDLGKASYS